MKRFLGTSLLIMSLCNITGCSYLTGPSDTYRYSHSVPKLVLPAGYSNAKMQDYYIVPPVPPGTKTRVSLLPPGSLAARKAWAQHTTPKHHK